jgi:hypothetical protein
LALAQLQETQRFTFDAGATPSESELIVFEVPRAVGCFATDAAAVVVGEFGVNVRCARRSADAEQPLPGYIYFVAS